jgi:hypothetical protein
VVETGVKLLRGIADWARSTAGAIWRLVAPHAGRGVAGGLAADVARSRRELVLENAMLRHQVTILRRKFPHPKLTTLDRLGLLVAAAVLPTWRRALAIVQPETLLRWHREGFRMFWRQRSRSGNLERRVAAETITLIREMATKNRLWGAERIRGELLKLGIKVSKRTSPGLIRASGSGFRTPRRTTTTTARSSSFRCSAASITTTKGPRDPSRFKRMHEVATTSLTVLVDLLVQDARSR